MLIPLILACGLQAPPPPQAPPIPPGYVVRDSKPCATCGKVNCDCGCKDGNNCVCTVPSATYYDVGGRIVKASSWAEAYRVAGTPQTAVTPSVTHSPAFAPIAAPAAFQVPLQASHAPQHFGGYSAPSFQGYQSFGGAACRGGG